MLNQRHQWRHTEITFLVPSMSHSMKLFFFFFLLKALIWIKCLGLVNGHSSSTLPQSLLARQVGRGCMEENRSEGVNGVWPASLKEICGWRRARLVWEPGGLSPKLIGHSDIPHSSLNMASRVNQKLYADPRASGLLAKTWEVHRTRNIPPFHPSPPRCQEKSGRQGTQLLSGRVVVPWGVMVGIVSWNIVRWIERLRVLVHELS